MSPQRPFWLIVAFLSCRQRWRKPSKESRATKGSLERWWSTQKVTSCHRLTEPDTQMLTGGSFVVSRVETLSLESELKSCFVCPNPSSNSSDTYGYLVHTNHPSKRFYLQCLHIPKKHYMVSSSETLVIHIPSGGPAKLSYWREGKLCDWQFVFSLML